MRAGLDSHQQSPRLNDLGHLVGRRETFERGRENRVSFNLTLSRLLKFVERKRGAPTAACIA
jgi:hypothetical protein